MGRAGHALFFFAENRCQGAERLAKGMRIRPIFARNDIRFYFHLLKTVVFLHFEVDLSGEKWSEVDLSGLASV
jgi:hypothetical protein